MVELIVRTMTSPLADSYLAGEAVAGRSNDICESRIDNQEYAVDRPLYKALASLYAHHINIPQHSNPASLMSERPSA